ncbi:MULTISPECIES: tyrosine-type recombinase/integrase [Hyphomicrobiales]|jgi:integrase|uniref:tyrosine-type recombinase/integrase n=1 Tax=Hyphomicrobiales TaxID=356 RepID=UPI000F687398|nr:MULTISPECIES: tyrosine-type recombinase/integrase [Hyphomicrobiales]MCH4538518.1 tyrosine-type recombinase/integrase [Ochrobactrum sp. A-1]MCR5944409.1 integrase [Ochrobactrum sp. XJ1]MCH4538610.1 tyrosine-type recombinase/integrase [Ochrobactrum sp. A-1]MCH4538991.1 tyrosine-type recombinase/integrase [Ochrobactrum sp. A-1]MCH4544154.1 tyrosine-type recombinase/integrase [Ochrobactrum sp. A-1]
MTNWPDPDRKLIARYIAGLNLRTTQSPIYYKQALNIFQDVAERHGKLDKDMLVAWLHVSPGRWASTTRLHRTRIIDRFLDHLEETGAIERNPVASLREACNIKQCKPVWRALASSDPDRALAELYRPRPFGSVLGNMMAEHVTLMRNRGYKYTAQAMRLWRLDRFLQLNPELQDQPLEVMLEHWSAAKTTRNHPNECEKLRRVLTKILRHQDPSIPPRRPDPRPEKEVARHWRKPHIYTPSDVLRMLDIARSYPSPRSPLRPSSIYTMLLLAYCAGLRRSELARLDLGDVDFQGGTITIRQTKFYKTRILPLPDSVMVELRSYTEARRRAGGFLDPRSGLFWHEQRGDRYTKQAVAWLLVDVIRRAGLKPPRGRTGPRLHDLRHSMVVNRILEWYEAGINPQDRLPFLATYLGHRDINSTLVYITVTQDLLHHANERFRVLGAPCLNIGQEVRA